MLFNSFAFLLFFSLVLILYYIIPNSTGKRIFLILSGIFFILQAGFISLIVISLITIFNYFVGINIEIKRGSRPGRLIFLIGILINIANLFLFKYYNFFNDSIQAVLGIYHLKSPLPQFELLLPIGISFYTFQLLSYLIDIRLNNIKSERNFLIFLNYVFFFPKLLAGPIERAQHFLPQSKESKNVDWNNFSKGGKLIIWGVFQKLVIADRITIYVDSVYNNVNMHSGITLLVCAVLYTFQVYADFSGYTDIARGTARMLGYDLTVNFNRPLLSSSITEFWRRWHISLSSWVNDYIYTPLSLTSRKFGMAGVVFSLYISFLVVGIWHGALWTFVVFGVLQGIILTIELLTLKKRKIFFKNFPKPLVKGAGTIIAFTLITISFIFFRSPFVAQAFLFLSKISISGKLFASPPVTLIYSGIGIFILLFHDIRKEYFEKDIFKIKSRFFIIRSFPYALLVIVILLIGVFDGGQFIYFQF